MKTPAISSLRAATAGFRDTARELPRTLAEVRRATNYPRRAARGIRGGIGGFPRVTPGFPGASISFPRGTNRLPDATISLPGGVKGTNLPVFS